MCIYNTTYTSETGNYIEDYLENTEMERAFFKLKKIKVYLSNWGIRGAPGHRLLLSNLRACLSHSLRFSLHCNCTNCKMKVSRALKSCTFYNSNVSLNNQCHCFFVFFFTYVRYMVFTFMCCWILLLQMIMWFLHFSVA